MSSPLVGNEAGGHEDDPELVSLPGRGAPYHQHPTLPQGVAGGAAWARPTHCSWAQAALRRGFQGLPCAGAMQSMRGTARLPDRDHALTRVLIWRGQVSSAQQPIPSGTKCVLRCPDSPHRLRESGGRGHISRRQRSLRATSFPAHREACTSTSLPSFLVRLLKWLSATGSPISLSGGLVPPVLHLP